MGRPKGSKNKAEISDLTDKEKVDIVFPPQQVLTPLKEQPDLVLTVRRIQAGSFAGLWELSKVLPDGTMQVLTDANTKGIVANLAYNEIAKCGT